MSEPISYSNAHFINDFSLWSAQFGLQLLEIVKLIPNAKILDIGTGLGFPAIELAMRSGDEAIVFGIDPWIEGLEFAKEKAGILNIQNIRFLKQYAENMSFEDQYFDTIVSNIGINNVQNLDMTFLECARVAKKGAQFAFSINTNQSMKEFYEIFNEILLSFGLSEDAKRIKSNVNSKLKPLAEIKNTVEKSGFEIKTQIDGEFSMRFATGSAFLNHHFIWQVFYPVWFGSVNVLHRKSVFERLESEINKIAKQNGEFKISIPYAIFDCIRI